MKQKELFPLLKKGFGGLMVLASALFTVGCDDKDEPEILPSEPVFTIVTENEIEIFEAGETRSFEVEAKNIASAQVSFPEGWTAVYEDDTLEVTAPETDGEAVETEGEVIIYYKGTDGSKGWAALQVQVVITEEPEEDPGQEPEPEPDPEDPEDSNYPTPDQSFKLDIQVPDFSHTVNFSVYPDNKEYPYWVTMDYVQNFEMYSSLEEYVADDVDFWNSSYGDLALMCYTGDKDFYNNDIPNGAYVLITYYYDAENGVAINPVASEYFTVVGSSSAGDEDEPYLGLSYSLDYGREGWDGLLGIPTTGKCIVVSSPDPNSAVAGWYYGIFSKDNIDGAYNSDDAIRNELKSNEEFHNKNMIINVVEFNTQWVLCGFWVDALGNEGPVERIPFTATLGESADWHFVDYEGVWTVSGTNMKGQKVSYDITLEENVYGDSFKVFGFTQTGNDRKYNAPVRLRYNNGILEFYESSVLGMDGDGYWLGFNGFIDNPEKQGAYASVNKDLTIAKAVRDNNTLRLTWENANISGYTVPFVAFSYGQMYDNYGDEYCVPYDEDIDYFIVKDLKITQKSTVSTMARKPKLPDVTNAVNTLARRKGKFSFNR